VGIYFEPTGEVDHHVHGLVHPFLALSVFRKRLRHPAANGAGRRTRISSIDACRAETLHQNHKRRAAGGNPHGRV
jgi:hypothetical protein